MISRHKKQVTIESYMLMNGKKGEHFYSDKTDRAITAIANYYNVKVSTERLITVNVSGKELKAKKITKITLV